MAVSGCTRLLEYLTATGWLAFTSGLAVRQDSLRLAVISRTFRRYKGGHP